MLLESSMLKASFEIFSTIRIPKGISVIRGFFIEFSVSS